jgi:sensor histidine kinase YesM
MMASLRLRWLDGITWRLVAMSAFVGAGVNSGNYVSGLLYSDDPVFVLEMLLGNMLSGLLVLFIAAVLLNARSPSLPRPLALAAAVVIGCLIGNAVLFFFVWWPAYEFFTFTIFYARQAIFPWAFVAAAWYIVQRSNERATALRERQVSRQRLEMRMVEARLNAMQAQVEPHFLFNTLAHVKRLCHTDPALARHMLESFCDYLRYALPQMRGNAATLGSELDLADAYLDIQRIRMGQRLNVDVAVPATLRDFKFPPMMLMSLVENAVKHGLSPLVEGGSIRIDAVTRNRALHVSVADTGRGFIKSSGTGIGLANISSRLASIYGRAGALTLAPNAPRGAVATITVPVADYAQLTQAD